MFGASKAKLSNAQKTKFFASSDLTLKETVKTVSFDATNTLKIYDFGALKHFMFGAYKNFQFLRLRSSQKFEEFLEHSKAKRLVHAKKHSFFAVAKFISQTSKSLISNAQIEA
jgi:hypothetical protein